MNKEFIIRNQNQSQQFNQVKMQQNNSIEYRYDNRNINIFYYSRISKLCIDLICMMNNYGIIDKFKLKCIDDMQELPKSLERVPTLIIIGIDKPLVANDAVKWFNDNRPYLQQQCSDLQNKKLLYNMTKSMYDQQGPKGFSINELGGISDDFAYTDTDQAQPKTFCGYGNDIDIIVTPPQDSKINEITQKKLLAEIENTQKNQDDEYKIIMKQEQINKIIQKERDQLIKNRVGI
jgi:hypothetical protein